MRELAGLPGLLGRVDADLLEQPPVTAPVPATLLPSLSAAVRHTRRRRMLVVAGLGTAAALGVAVVVSQVVDDGRGAAAGSSPSASAAPSLAPEPAARTMRPVGDVPVRAQVSLEGVTWGTKLGLVCTYEPESVGYELPAAVDYTLFVRTRDGRSEQVGSWRSVGGRTMRLSGGTAATPADIASVEVRAPGGRVVLRLAL